MAGHSADAVNLAAKVRAAAERAMRKAADHRQSGTYDGAIAATAIEGAIGTVRAAVDSFLSRLPGGRVTGGTKTPGKPVPGRTAPPGAKVPGPRGRSVTRGPGGTRD